MPDVRSRRTTGGPRDLQRFSAKGRKGQFRLVADGRRKWLPSITVVTATYNRAGFIEDAIRSVQEQTYEGPVEHVVVDGASTDDTLSRLGKYPHLQVVSEPDDGVYDAYNKGIRIATGELVGILNDDDVYPPGALQAVVETYLAEDDLDTVAGNAVVFDDGPNGRRRLLTLSERPATHLTMDNLNWVTPMLNARFFKAQVFDRYGLFDTRYRVEADLDFLVRLALAKVKSGYSDHDVLWYRSHQGSMTLNNLGLATDTYTAERLDILDKHLVSGRPVRRDRRSLRRLHTWQSCTAIAMLAQPASFRAVPFISRGVARDVWFVPRMVQFACSPGRRANPWRGIERLQAGSQPDLAPPRQVS